VLIAWIAYEAAKLVLGEIASEDSRQHEPQYLHTLSPSGEKILSVPQSEPLYPHYKFKIWLMATLVITLMGGFSYVTWDKTNYEHKPDDISQINDADFLDVVSKWGASATLTGSTGGEGYEEINTTRLLPFRDKYDVMLVARVHDTHLSALKDPAIQKSNSFPIPALPTSSMRITIRIPSSFLASLLSTGGNGEMEYHLCLIPHSLDPSTIVTLDDVKARGGHVFGPSHGGGMTVGATAPAIPLAPSSPDAHSVISEIFVGSVKDEAQRNLTVDIHFVAASDVQVHADARIRFMLGRRPIETNSLAMDFVSRGQIQDVRASVNFSPSDWSDFISGSVPLTVQIPAEYRDRGMRTQHLVTGTINGKSDELANLKTKWIKLQ
jgi:hypothetical protein